jgi:hypothetical protein
MRRGVPVRLGVGPSTLLLVLYGSDLTLAPFECLPSSGIECWDEFRTQFIHSSEFMNVPI